MTREEEEKKRQEEGQANQTSWNPFSRNKKELAAVMGAKYGDALGINKKRFPKNTEQETTKYEPRKNEIGDYTMPEGMSDEDVASWEKAYDDTSDNGGRAEVSRASLDELSRKYDKGFNDSLYGYGAASEFNKDLSDRITSSREKNGTMYNQTDQEREAFDFYNSLDDKELRELERDIQSKYYTKGQHASDDSIANWDISRDKYLEKLKAEGRLNENDPVTKARLEGRVPTKEEYQASTRAALEKYRAAKKAPEQASREQEDEGDFGNLPNAERQTKEQAPAPAQAAPQAEETPQPEQQQETAAPAEQPGQQEQTPVTAGKAKDFSMWENGVLVDPETGKKVLDEKGDEITQEKYDALQKEAAEKGVSVSELLNEKVQREQSFVNAGGLNPETAKEDAASAENTSFGEEGDFGNLDELTSATGTTAQERLNRNRINRQNKRMTELEQRTFLYRRMSPVQLEQRERRLRRNADRLAARGKKNEAEYYINEANTVASVRRGEDPTEKYREQQEADAQAQIDREQQLTQYRDKQIRDARDYMSKMEKQALDRAAQRERLAIARGNAEEARRQHNIQNKLAIAAYIRAGENQTANNLRNATKEQEEAIKTRKDDVKTKHSTLSQKHDLLSKEVENTEKNLGAAYRYNELSKQDPNKMEDSQKKELEKLKRELHNAGAFGSDGTLDGYISKLKEDLNGKPGKEGLKARLKNTRNQLDLSADELLGLFGGNAQAASINL